jgi:hypothetical protein
MQNNKELSATIRKAMEQNDLDREKLANALGIRDHGRQATLWGHCAFESFGKADGGGARDQAIDCASHERFAARRRQRPKQPSIHTGSTDSPNHSIKKSICCLCAVDPLGLHQRVC